MIQKILAFHSKFFQVFLFQFVNFVILKNIQCNLKLVNWFCEVFMFFFAILKSKNIMKVKVKYESFDKKIVVTCKFVSCMIVVIFLFLNSSSEESECRRRVEDLSSNKLSRMMFMKIPVHLHFLWQVLHFKRKGDVNVSSKWNKTKTISTANLETFKAIYWKSSFLPKKLTRETNSL